MIILKNYHEIHFTFPLILNVYWVEVQVTFNSMEKREIHKHYVYYICDADVEA